MARSAPVIMVYWMKTSSPIIVDGMKDVMRLSDGSKFSPRLNKKTAKNTSIYIAEEVVVGKNSPFVGAIVSIDMANVGKWAESRKITYTTYTDLSKRWIISDVMKSA